VGKESYHPADAADSLRQPGRFHGGDVMADSPNRPAADRRSPIPGEEILDLLIAPATAQTFLAAHWERAPLLAARAEAERFAPVLTPRQVEGYLEGADLRHPPVRLARLGGIETSAYTRSRSYGGRRVDGVVDGEALLREHGAGASIVIDRAHEVFPSLGRTAAALERYTGLPAQASVFVTPAGAQSFPVHYDPAGVFVLQIAGRKIWRLFDRPADWPLQEHYDPREPLPDHGVALEVELSAGSTLYVPRGHYHQVVTTESHSIHVSLGVLPLTWTDVLRRLGDQLSHLRELREAPVEQILAVRDPEALRRKWHALLDKAKEIDPLLAWSDPAASGVHDQQGRLDDLWRLPEISLDTPLRVRQDRAPRVEVLPDGVRLRFADRGIRLPAELAETLRELLRLDRVTPALLAEPLAADDALELTRLLVREGVLTHDRHDGDRERVATR
jgi:bifunctional lysine-specific demethylase and histidyl-hydroxylase NO66